MEISDLDEDRIRGDVRAGVRGNRLHASADTDSVEIILTFPRLKESTTQKMR